MNAPDGSMTRSCEDWQGNFHVLYRPGRCIQCPLMSRSHFHLKPSRKSHARWFLRNGARHGYLEAVMGCTWRLRMYVALMGCMWQPSTNDNWGFTVEPRYNEFIGTMEITLLYQVSHYIRVKKQRNIKSWDQQNYLVIRGFCYIRPLYNEVPLYMAHISTYVDAQGSCIITPALAPASQWHTVHLKEEIPVGYPFTVYANIFANLAKIFANFEFARV